MATEEVDRDSLEQYRLTSVPRSLYYIPNFITAEEASHLLDNVSVRRWFTRPMALDRTDIDWQLQVNSPAARWTVLSHRRLQAIPSPLSTKDILLASPIPNWLESPIIPRLLALKHDDKSLFSNAPHKKPNHVLVNEYQPGQGIMPHEDGAAYWPVVATVSLGSPLVLDIYGKDTHDLRETEPRYRLLQEPLRFADETSLSIDIAAKLD
ncbi:MAG: hypothetical protein M1814_006232 [Vezdaea aestivalis]|nr:MAG: hypothetical protein M1814_006232 [Vezdaea aestivalis]